MDRLLQAQLEDDPLLTEAAEWFFEMRSDEVSGERIAEWQQWLSDATNRGAFGRVEALWRLIDGATVRWPAEAEVAADGYSGTESITAWRLRCGQHAEPKARRRAGIARNWRVRRMAIVGIAAAAAAAAITFVAYWPILAVALQGGSRIAVATRVSDTRTISLPDGTVVSAGADTDLVATFLQRSRTVVLRHGEAYFRVVKDPSRPFTVRVGDATVTDVGTAFDVRRTLNGVVVAVAEGVVNVATRSTGAHIRSLGHPLGSIEAPGLAPIELSAGERLALESFDTLPHLSPVNPNSVAGWRKGRLQYVDEPLDGVIADLARYSDRRIVLATPAVANLRVTGVVYVQDIDGWLSSLEATFPLRVLPEKDGTTLIEQR